MSQLPPCPKCSSSYTYQDRTMFICPECGHEWPESSLDSKGTGAETAGLGEKVYKDAHGNLLQDGDSVTLIKELKVKGSSAAIKIGTKIKAIRLVDGDDGHDIDCKIPGFGAMRLKSEFVKKSK